MELRSRLDDETINEAVRAHVERLGAAARLVTSLAVETILRPHGVQVLQRMFRETGGLRFVFFVLHSDDHWSFALLVLDTEPATMYHIDSITTMRSSLHARVATKIAKTIADCGRFGSTVNVVFPGEAGGQEDAWECGHYVIAAAKVSVEAAERPGPLDEAAYFDTLWITFHDLRMQIRVLTATDGD